MRIALIVIVSLVGFGGGFVGVYLAMPEPVGDGVASDSTGAAEVDSLATDSLSLAMLPPGVGLEISRDSLLAGPNSLAAERLFAEIDTLVDSLNVARSLLQVAESTITQLEARISILNQEANAQNSRRDVAVGMATTLPKLELKDLGPILGGLTDSALLDLYDAASSRNRPIILQALTADRASLLVQQFLNPDAVEVPASVAPPDTLTN